jgi:hypothetical protein
MSAVKQAVLFLVIIALLAGGMSVSLYLERRQAASEVVLRVGAGNDITGLLMGDLVAAATGAELNIRLNTFMDCCGNSAQWAITSDELDVGFYCGSIALTLINRDSDLEIYGPTVMNAEMVALGSGKEKADICAMAIPLKRSFLADIAAESFPSVRETPQVSTTALLYALSGGQVDGALVDIAKAFAAPDFNYARLSGEDHISYYLVVNRNIVDTPRFDAFLEAYNQMAASFNDVEYLKERYNMGDSFWREMNTRFLYLS